MNASSLMLLLGMVLNKLSSLVTLLKHTPYAIAISYTPLYVDRYIRGWGRGWVRFPKIGMGLYSPIGHFYSKN